MAEEYRGTLNKTNTGRYCQRWDIDYPHAQDVNEPSMVREETVSDAHNFCRNVWRLKSPWCHTLNPDFRREFCDVPVCSEYFLLIYFRVKNLFTYIKTNRRRRSYNYPDGLS